MIDNTIFIQIASYRDPQLNPTIKDCLDKAKNPQNLRFGISWQHSDDDDWDNLNEYKNDNRFKIIDIDYKESKGACWARNYLQSLYNNEKYTLQLDSHHRFVEDWDEILINMLVELQENGYRKPLVTSYLPSFNPDNDPKERVNVPWLLSYDRFIPEGAVFFKPKYYDFSKMPNKPILGRFYSAHFAFSLGSFAKEVKHDPNYYFHGEEISIAVRAFTHGYDIFYPNKVIAWHEYTRKNRIKQWDDDKKWTDKNSACHYRNRKLFGMNVKDDGTEIDFGEYGFGSVRTLKDYEKYAGMKFSKRSVTQELLDDELPSFDNLNITDEEFEKKLLSIFKHCIDIDKSRIPNKTDYDFWCVAFKDENDKEIYRQDANKEEIDKILKQNDKYQIWRSFENKSVPFSWVVWPHSVSDGWLEPIRGRI